MTLNTEAQLGNRKKPEQQHSWLAPDVLASCPAHSEGRAVDWVRIMCGLDNQGGHRYHQQKFGKFHPKSFTMWGGYMVNPIERTIRV